MLPPPPPLPQSLIWWRWSFQNQNWGSKTRCQLKQTATFDHFKTRLIIEAHLKDNLFILNSPFFI